MPVGVDVDLGAEIAKHVRERRDVGGRLRPEAKGELLRKARGQIGIGMTKRDHGKKDDALGGRALSLKGVRGRYWGDLRKNGLDEEDEPTNDRKDR